MRVLTSHLGYGLGPARAVIAVPRDGRNNADYASDFPNIPGGIVNGITSGWADEQWIPHTGWFLLAVATAP